MVEPSALAETVTPSILSPAADLIDPLSTTSAAFAEGAKTAKAASARPMAVVAAKLLAIPLAIRLRIMAGLLIVVSSVRRIGRCGCGRRGDRQGLDVGNDGVDLVGTEMILEARHVRRAAADEFTHDVFLSAQRHPGQQRAKVPHGRDLHLHVTDDAGLGEQVSPHDLLVVESLLGLLRRRARRDGMEYRRLFSDHSGFAPENLITLRHFSVSSATSLLKSADEPGSTVPPRS